MATRVTVIVCTFNRCESLVDTLNSLSAMQVPAEIDWDVLVIDNNSTDQTGSRVETVARETGLRVRCLVEKRQGLSHARNLGVSSTTSEYIAFTDDDVLVRPDWLAKTVQTFQAYAADCVGGKVVPHWLQPPPPWLSTELLNVLAMLDYGDRAFEFSDADPRILFGANFAFRRQCLVDLGMFNVDLGRKGDVGVGEDQDIFRRLKASGGKAVYNPEIAVRHKVPPERMEKAYFRKWYYVAGRDRAKLTRASRFLVLGIESFLLVNFTKTACRFAASLLDGSPQRFFHELNCILYLSVFKHKLLKAPAGVPPVS